MSTELAPSQIWAIYLNRIHQSFRAFGAGSHQPEGVDSSARLEPKKIVSTKRSIVLRFAPLFLCVFSCAWVLFAHGLYSVVFRRPLLQTVINVLELPKESFIGYASSQRGWDSNLYQEFAMFVIPRDTSIEEIKTKLASIGIREGRGTSFDSESAIKQVIAQNRLPSVVSPQMVRGTGKSDVFSGGRLFSPSGTYDVKIVDVRPLWLQYVVDSRNLDDHYVLIVAVIDEPFGKKCSSLDCLLPF